MKNKKLILLYSLVGFSLLLFNFNCECTSDPTSSSSDTSKVLKGNYTTDVTLEADSTWTLQGTVKFQDGTVLTIEEGVTIKGDSSVLSYLIIDRGAKIMAIGTAAKPIVFTSDLTAGNRSSQDWGGIVINGYATINNGSGTPKVKSGEGDSGDYGGNDDTDNSGRLEYIRIEFAGKQFDDENELNGLALQGVGSGTVIENIHLHNCSDDGIEMFGGTVNLHNVISTANGDDQIDCTGGWRGDLVNAFVAPIGGDKGLEFDGNGDDNEATPYTTVNINNIIYLDNQNASGDDAFRFREGARVNLTHAYIAGATGYGIDIVDDLTRVSVTNVTIEKSGGSISVTNTPTVSVDPDTVVSNHMQTTLTGGLTLDPFATKSTLDQGASNFFTAAATNANFTNASF